MTDLEAVITASERTLKALEARCESMPVEFSMTLGLLASAIFREQTFLAHLRELQRGIYG